jgi:hypothetical protein
MYLRETLPDHHLSADSKEALKLATGLIATISALVLSLLISSAKASFDRVNNELVENAARVVSLDRVLADFGPDAQALRDSIKRTYSESIKLLTSGDPSAIAKLDNPEETRKIAALIAGLQQLAPKTDAQRALKSRAIQIAGDVTSTRTLVLLHKDGSIPRALLIVLVTWLVVIFTAFGLFAPRNHTAIAGLFLGALSAAGAILLILEMDRPFSGLISINSAPLLDAAARLGQ